MSVIDRPSLDEIRSWGKSFDRLMRSQAGRKVFRDFLRVEYSEENIQFWLACEDLKVETNAERIEEKARYIYEDYISILSPKEVSVCIYYLYYWFPIRMKCGRFLAAFRLRRYDYFDLIDI